MSSLAKWTDNSPQKEFSWRSRDGKRYPISLMESRHLGHTLVMIWNHTMPEDAATHDYIRYSFSKTYTRQYMLDAVKALLPELRRRKDIPQLIKFRLIFMENYILNKRPKDFEQLILAIEKEPTNV